MDNTEQVTRVELIDHREGSRTFGRYFVAFPCKVTLSPQDGGRTLKIFVDDRPKAPATPIDPDAPFDYQPYKHRSDLAPFDGNVHPMKCVEHWRASRDFWYDLAAVHAAAKRGPMAEYAIKRAREFQQRLENAPLGRDAQRPPR